MDGTFFVMLVHLWEKEGMMLSSIFHASQVRVPLFETVTNFTHHFCFVFFNVFMQRVYGTHKEKNNFFLESQPSKKCPFNVHFVPESFAKKKARNVFFWKFGWSYTYFPWLNYLIFNQSQWLLWFNFRECSECKPKKRSFSTTKKTLVETLTFSNVILERAV